MSVQFAILLYDDRAKTNLTPPLIIEVPVPNQENERSCICLPFSTILIFDIGIVPTVW